MSLLATMDVGQYILHHMEDHPWAGCQFYIGSMPVTWMSSGIAAMLLAAVTLVAVVVPLARPVGVGAGAGAGPKLSRGKNLLEIIVVFVRDNIARPALHRRAYAYLSFLTSLFVFILAMNLIGLIPLGPVFTALGHHIPFLRGRPIGGAATSIGTVCLAMAAIAFATLIGAGLVQSAKRFHRKHHWPMAVCVLLSPVLWFLSLCPPISGVPGIILLVPLAALELFGAILKCISLMIRLCANMLAGHVLLAVLMLFTLQTLSSWIEYGSVHLFYVGPLCIAGSVMASLLDLLVAGIQAYIFTFLTAIFLGMYAEASH